MHFYPWQSITGTFYQTCSFCMMYISTCLYSSSRDPVIPCDCIFLLIFKSQVQAISDPYVVPSKVMNMISDMLYNNFSQELLRLPFIDFLHLLIPVKRTVTKICLYAFCAYCKILTRTQRQFCCNNSFQNVNLFQGNYILRNNLRIMQCAF